MADRRAMNDDPTPWVNEVSAARQARWAARLEQTTATRQVFAQRRRHGLEARVRNKDARAERVDLGDPQAAYDLAVSAYLTEHAEPSTLDVACPRCAAGPGFPCYWRGKTPSATPGAFHVGREREAEDARRRRFHAARAHGEVARLSAMVGHIIDGAS